MRRVRTLIAGVAGCKQPQSGQPCHCAGTAKATAQAQADTSGPRHLPAGGGSGRAARACESHSSETFLATTGSALALHTGVRSHGHNNAAVVRIVQMSRIATICELAGLVSRHSETHYVTALTLSLAVEVHCCQAGSACQINSCRSGRRLEQPLELLIAVQWVARLRSEAQQHASGIRLC